jgi:hypothetical protein
LHIELSKIASGTADEIRGSIRRLGTIAQWQTDRRCQPDYYGSPRVDHFLGGKARLPVPPII